MQLADVPVGECTISGMCQLGDMPFVGGVSLGTSTSQILRVQFIIRTSPRSSIAKFAKYFSDTMIFF